MKHAFIHYLCQPELNRYVISCVLLELPNQKVSGQGIRVCKFHNTSDSVTGSSVKTILNTCQKRVLLMGFRHEGSNGLL